MKGAGSVGRINSFFRISERGSSIRSEAIGGVTTFFTAAYIIFVNPAILSAAGMDAGAVMLSTCLSAAFGTLIMGLIANQPFVLAPGMGVNAFFAYTICGVYGYSWQTALAAVFVSGLIFILLTVTGARKAILNAIPVAMKKAISAGVGIFVSIIGLEGTGIIADSPATLVTLGNFAEPKVLLSIIGLAICICMLARKVRGGLFIAIILTSAVGAVMQFGFGVDVGITFGAQASTDYFAGFGSFISGFGGLLKMDNGIALGILSLFYILISLVIIDIFDTMGLLIAMMYNAGKIDEKGNIPGAEKVLLADAVSTVVGAAIGTSTVTTYAESSAGISAGARTGFANVVTAGCFLLAIVFAPILGIIPGSATYPVLVIVGVYMISSVSEIDWSDMGLAIPSFLTIIMMAFSYSIADGIAFGCISYVLMRVVSGKYKQVHPIMYVIVAIIIARFTLQSISLV